MFDDLAGTMASQLSDIFGSECTFTRPGAYSFSVRAVIRKDVELLDEYQQVVGRTNTVRIAHGDIDLVPERGDLIERTLPSGVCETFKLGKRIADDSYSYTFEATT